MVTLDRTIGRGTAGDGSKRGHTCQDVTTDDLAGYGHLTREPPRDHPLGALGSRGQA